MKIYQLIFNLICICFSCAIFANDTTGTTAAGGITFTKMPGITIDREELQVSPKKIKVSYLFYNHSNQDITTTVYFPVPIFTSNDSEDASNLTTEQPFGNFSVTAQGQPVSFQTTTRAILNGKDISAQLQQANIPISAAADSKSTWQTAAQKLGLLDNNSNPKWQQQTVYSWTQTFPAHQLLLIEHQYEPAAGAFFSTVESGKTPDELMSENLQRLKSIFNLDLNKLDNGKAVTTWLNNQMQTGNNANGINAYFYNVDYILTTGANWDGPIKNFSLIINKPQHGVIAYNHFYQGKINLTDSPTQTKIFIDNFAPKQDLKILFVSKDNL